MGDETANKARYEVVRQFDRLGIYNRRDRLERAGELAGRPIDAFLDLNVEEALAVAARLAEEPTPDVDAGV